MRTEPKDGAHRGHRLAALGCCVVLLAAAGCAGEERLFTEVVSPDGAWTLRITVAESRLPQGPFHVVAYLLESGAASGTKLFATTLENDGVPFTARNVAGRWTGVGTALVCLRASDRPDRGWRIDTGPPPAANRVDAC